MRSRFQLALGILATLAALTTSTTEAKQPNVVLIMTDDK